MPSMPKYFSRDVLFEFHLFWNTASIGIPVRSLLSGLPAQQKGTTAQWHSNKTAVPVIAFFKLMILLSILWLIFFK